MEFFGYHRDRPSSLTLRDELLEEHWSYMDRYSREMIARGPTFASHDDTPTGSMHIGDLSDPAAARAFAFDERHMAVAPDPSESAPVPSAGSSGVAFLPREGLMEPVKIVTCGCGQRWRGTEAELVAAVRQHGLDVHNMPVTDDQVRAMAVDEDAVGDGDR